MTLLRSVVFLLAFCCFSLLANDERQMSISNSAGDTVDLQVLWGESSEDFFARHANDSARFYRNSERSSISYDEVLLFQYALNAAYIMPTSYPSFSVYEAEWGAWRPDCGEIWGVWRPPVGCVTASLSFSQAERAQHYKTLIHDALQYKSSRMFGFNRHVLMADDAEPVLVGSVYPRVMLTLLNLYEQLPTELKNPHQFNMQHLALVELLWRISQHAPSQLDFA